MRRDDTSRTTQASRNLEKLSAAEKKWSWVGKSVLDVCAIFIVSKLLIQARVWENSLNLLDCMTTLSKTNN